MGPPGVAEVKVVAAETEEEQVAEEPLGARIDAGHQERCAERRDRRDGVGRVGSTRHDLDRIEHRTG